jgi:hypothetical protein
MLHHAIYDAEAGRRHADGSRRFDRESVSAGDGESGEEYCEHGKPLQNDEAGPAA